MTYTDPIRLLFKGDVEKAKRYVREARRFAFDLLRQAADSGVLTLRRIRRLVDGTTIDLTVAGTLVTAVITAPEGGELRQKQEGFVVWARRLDMPDGIDAEHPQQILEQGKRRQQYQTFVFNNEVLVGRRDGTYGGTFPEGITRAGNIDWVSADNERISWFGPGERCWSAAYVNPKEQFGKFVFMLGEVLLDVDAYFEDIEDPTFPRKYVVGAALQKLDGQVYLITVQSTGDDGVTDMTPIPNGEGRYTYPLAPQNTSPSQQFIRYTLEQYVDVAGVSRYRVIAGSAIGIGTIQLGHMDQWFFNESCTQAICHSMLTDETPSTPWWACRLDDPTNPPDDDDTTATEYFPGPSSLRTIVNIGDATVTLDSQANISVEAAGEPAPVTADWFGDELREYHISLDSNFVPYFNFDGASVPLWLVEDQGDDTHGLKRCVLYASPRDQLVVFYVYDLLFNGSEIPATTTRGKGVSLEVWYQGQLVSNQHVHNTNVVAPNFLVRSFRPNAQIYAHFAGKRISPYFYVYGLSVMMQGLPDSPGEDTWFGDASPNFIGCNSSYADFYYPSSTYFGTYDRSIDPGAPPRAPTPISTFSKNGFSGNRQDFDDHYTFIGAAANDSTAMVSVAVQSTDMSRSMNFVSDGSLPALTGITGAGERYHPIWILGKPAKETV